MTVTVSQVARTALVATPPQLRQVARESMVGTPPQVGIVCREVLRSIESTTPTCSDLLTTLTSGVVVAGSANDAWIDDFLSGNQDAAP